MWNELKAIHARLQELLGAKHPDCILLGATLNCRNCNQSRYRGKVNGAADVWECLLYGFIPKEHLGDGCDSWVNNVGVGYPEGK